MATVPELKAQAKSLGITGYSAMRKPELMAAIAKFHASDDAELDFTPEELSNKINTADPTATPSDREIRAQRAREAGSRGVSASPMAADSRELNYSRQNAAHCKPLTPAQARRMRKKGNKARGMGNATLADFREMRRRMKRAGMIPAGQR